MPMEASQWRKDLEKSAKQKARAKAGYKTEDIAVARLKGMGFLGVTPVHRAWKVIDHKPRVIGRSSPAQVLAVPSQTVLGDIIGMCPGGAGMAMLAECKSNSFKEGKRPKLSLSSFRPHQIETLTKHHRDGGLALVIWLQSDPKELIGYGLHVLPWPIKGLGRGSPLSWEDAGDESIKIAPRYRRVRV